VNPGGAVLRGVACAGLVALGCSGSGARADGGADSSIFCGSPAPFPGSCGGTASGTGTTPLGTAFAPTAVNALLGETCTDAGVSYHLASIELLLGAGPDVVLFTFDQTTDGGAVPFIGAHEVSARFESLTCDSSTPPSSVVSITAINANATVDITAGDDPSAAPQPATGTVTGTVMFSGAGQSGSGSFSTPYCVVAACPIMN
jgi:hypothetical protein